MPQQFELPMLQPGADQAAKSAGDLYNDRNLAKQKQDYALAQLIKGTDEGIRKHKADTQTDMDAIGSDQMKDVVNRGGSAKVGDVSVGADPYARMFGRQMGQSRQDAQALGKDAEHSFGTINGQLDALKTIHALITNPNSVDTQQAQTQLARLSEGQGQRLLESVISHSGADPTAVGKGIGFTNYLTSGALSKLRPDQVSAIEDNLNKHAGLLQSQYGTAKKSYMARAPMLAPYLSQQPGMLDQFTGSYTSPIEQKMAEFNQIHQGVANAGQTQEAQGGLKGWLRGHLNPTMTQTAGAPVAPRAPLAPPQGPPAQTVGIDPAAIDAEIARRSGMGGR